MLIPPGRGEEITFLRNSGLIHLSHNSFLFKCDYWFPGPNSLFGDRAPPVVAATESDGHLQVTGPQTQAELLLPGGPSANYSAFLCLNFPICNRAIMNSGNVRHRVPMGPIARAPMSIHYVSEQNKHRFQSLWIMKGKNRGGRWMGWGQEAHRCPGHK